jgi:hypothetical protein
MNSPVPLPTKFETGEDYTNICENFLLPLFKRQAEKIRKLIDETHTLIKDNPQIDEEKLNLLINQLKDCTVFSLPDSNMNPLFQAVMALEDKLESEGYFNDA